MKTKAELYREAFEFIYKHEFNHRSDLRAFIQLITKGVETQEAIKILRLDE